MSEPERKIFKSDPPFRLKQETEHTHKLYFLYFINQRAPEVSDSLRQLTEECKSLFGDFPESATYYGDDKQRQEQWRINRVFGECINSETRKNSGYTRWQDILTETDANLKSALNELKLYWDKRDIYVKDLMNNRKDEFRKIVSEVYKIPEKEITDADLDPALGGVYYRNLRKTDKDFVKLENIADKKKGELESFQQAFDSAVNKFSLTKSWLERAAFLAIWRRNWKTTYRFGIH